MKTVDLKTIQTCNRGKTKQSSLIQTILGKIKLKGGSKISKIWENSCSCNRVVTLNIILWLCHLVKPMWNWEFFFSSGRFDLPFHGKVDPLIDRFVLGSIEFKNPLMHGYSRMIYLIYKKRMEFYFIIMNSTISSPSVKMH